MAKKILSKFEIILIFLFVASLTIYLISTCRSTRLAYELEQLQEKVDEAETKQTTAPDQPVQTTAPAPQATTLAEPPRSGIIASDLPAPNTQLPAQPTATSQVTTTGAMSSNSKLYVTIDQLKLRAKPDLSSKVLRQLSLFDEVYYMNSVSEKIDTINLGNGIATDPWVFIKTADGMKGWVYGAGVNYYKKKNPKAI